jgi:hypothetical protein
LADAKGEMERTLTQFELDEHERSVDQAMEHLSTDIPLVQNAVLRYGLANEQPQE